MWRESLTHQIMIRIKCFSFNPFQECCTVASDESGKAVIVDPGCYDENEISVLTSYIAGSGLQIEKILLTHGHFDHIFGVSALAERYDVPVLMSPADKVILENNGIITDGKSLPHRGIHREGCASWTGQRNFS